MLSKAGRLALVGLTAAISAFGSPSTSKPRPRVYDFAIDVISGTINSAMTSPS